MKQQPRAIIFDWDNTLVNTGKGIFLAINKTLESMGKEPWTPEYARKNIQLSCRESFPLLFGDRAHEAEEIFYRYVEEFHLDNLNPLPDTPEALAHFSAQNIPMGIVSNKRGSLLRQEITHLGWDEHFPAIIGSGDAPRDKPAPDPLLLALTTLGIPPSSEVWMVGDMPVDWQCAQAAGCSPVAVGDHPDRDEFCQIQVFGCADLKKIWS